MEEGQLSCGLKDKRMSQKTTSVSVRDHHENLTDEETEA